MFGLFNKKNKVESVPFSFPKVDIHSHLIPGIDDGSPDLPTTINYLTELQELGYEYVITTPHVMMDMYPNSMSTILKGCDEVRNAITQVGLKIEFDTAAEYFIDEQFLELIANNQLLSFGRDQYILFEMSFMQESLLVERVIFDLKAKGYTPLLAHPERYNYYLQNHDNLHHFKELGCKLQLNLNSVTGYYGSKQKALALKLLREGLVDFVGTDLHHEKHLNALKSLIDTSVEPMLLKAVEQNNSIV
ncbi:histidinol phosphatase [Solitalea sp. MAHUQ-68]|uniref:protein-tyrosine-phosphatase n=1 Tax=Solitalea agri TaxID=2953739 RepID=A0A9X2JE80_9SPHI|nr:CpsB/CapC family capsule biosynthesis tyrosine phosphatase [Solitalea agri]MCO4292106.1 histidinol phosphatase [Solitalea agri]